MSSALLQCCEWRRIGTCCTLQVSQGVDYLVVFIWSRNGLAFSLKTCLGIERIIDGEEGMFNTFVSEIDARRHVACTIFVGF